MKKKLCHLWLPFLVLKRDEKAGTLLLVFLLDASNAPSMASGASSAMVIVAWLSS